MSDYDPTEGIRRAEQAALNANAGPRAKLTLLEATVLRVLIKSAAGNGDDFGFIEDARDAVNPKQLGGVVSSLVKKGVINVHEAVTTDSGRWTQFTWPVEEEQRAAYVAKVTAAAVSTVVRGGK